MVGSKLAGVSRGLGQSAPNPVVTTLKYFRDEYDAHVTGDGCPAGTCKTSEAVTERAEVTV